ncbi:Gfo/Idh/MocA family protein [Alicyclobacillus shizuokensis]|uniref:Gfo/Idh/MocA family protein n=1 Tax=Alicyclobacillus shizuokensis TaxID=392014 RepID=UPI00082C82CE|nr:Gfo/Idh/MocA family oxidoreductase [Alicyclobacillus shizuokensis]
MTEYHLGVGILSFAHMHAYTYADILRRMPSVRIQAVADFDEERGRAAQARFGGAFYQDYQALLTRDDIEAVIVCSENSRHAEMVIAAAQAHKHVLCEKPMATRVEDAQRMIETCRQHGVKLQIAFPVRYCSPLRRLKQTVDAGRLGRIVAIRGTNHGQNPGGWFVERQWSGGGAVMDHTVHVVDIMRWLTHSEVREVYAEIDTRFYDIETDDCGLLMLEFDNGVFASHDPSWSRPQTYPTWGDVTLEVVGTEGITRVDALAQHLNVYQDQEGRYQHVFFGDSMDAGLLTDFVACVRTDKEPFISGEDGLRALEVTLAAYESAQSGRPVRLR